MFCDYLDCIASEWLIQWDDVAQIHTATGLEVPPMYATSQINLAVGSWPQQRTVQLFLYSVELPEQAST